MIFYIRGNQFVEYFFPKPVFDSLIVLCESLQERDFELVEGFHFNFFNTHPFAKFPEMKFKFWNQQSNKIAIYSINRFGIVKVVGTYNEGEL